MSERTSRSKAAPKPSAKSSAPAVDSKAVAALEAKVKALEARLEEQAQLLASLQAAVSSPSASGRDEDLVRELRRYFASASSAKQVTYWPKL